MSTWCGKLIWTSILQARTFLDPSEIFKGEIEETIEKVRKACNILDAYRNTYEDHKERLKSYFPEGTEPRLWEFAPKLVFARYDKFVERVKTVRVRSMINFQSQESIYGSYWTSDLMVMVIFLILFFPGTDGDCFRVHEAGEGRAWWHQGKTAESAGGPAAWRVPGTVWSLHQQNLWLSRPRQQCKNSSF